jgi:hypothetical protein
MASCCCAYKNGSWFSEPWGIVHAPSRFGIFSNAILVANTASGEIVAFNSFTEKFLGFWRTPQARRLRTPACGRFPSARATPLRGPVTTLYFTAGIQGFAHGLFGSITAY